MRISEIIDPNLSIFERIAAPMAVTVVEKYSDRLEKISKNFSVPIRKILPNDTVYEIIDDLNQIKNRIDSLSYRLPLTEKLIQKLLHYLDPH